VSAPHFLVASLEAAPLMLPREASHHAVRALRMRAGEVITLTDGAGGRVDGIVAEADPDALRVEVTARTTISRPHPRLTVAFALTKGAKPEFTVEKLTELGIDRIIPWSAIRSVVAWDEAKRHAHGERMRATAIAALQQSRRCWLPEVLDPLPDRAALADVIGGDEVIALDADAHEPLPSRFAAPTTLVIGPEGGLTEEELDAFPQRARINDGVLRAETAALAAAALLAARRIMASGA
jgi:16S rRNA (uracil1498-N3)-methyltransferase